MKKIIGLLALLGLAIGAPAQESKQPPRWIKADDLRVRDGPGLDQAVRGLLQRGDEVILKSPDQSDGFCLIEGQGLYGYAACQYLSAEPVARARAGQGGVPADRRWVTGAGVNLRSGPSREAAAVSRLALNRAVRLLRIDAGGYCEVQPLDRAGIADGSSGFTACQYLALEPLSAGQLNGETLDPVQGFWRSPSWSWLESYATTLRARSPAYALTGPWPRDEALERMKAHLALGVKAPPAALLADWAALKQLAEAHDPALLDAGARRKTGSSGDRELQMRTSRAESAALRMQSALHLYGELHETISLEGGGGAHVVRLVRALELPTVKASFFRSEAELAPPFDGPKELAGRFGAIYRTTVTPRVPNRPESYAGLYDMLGRTEALTRPVQFVRLYRDGRLQSRETTASRSEWLWREVDEPMCGDWIAGFNFGEAAAPIWRYFDEPGNVGSRELRQRAQGFNPPGSLFAYYAPKAPPLAKATRSEQRVKLDREATGFIGFTQLGYDLDGDGVPDLLVLEGAGIGPGHLGGQSHTDDAWYRLVLVNVAGAWKVLASDSFSYGCGC